MTRTQFLVLFLSTLFLIIVYQGISKKDSQRNVSMENVQGFINDYNHYKTLNKTLTSVKDTNCRTILSKYWRMSLDDKILKLLTENCFENEPARTKSIFDKQFLEGQLGVTSCQETKPKFLNKSGPLVALASFPGSGNTWTRVLLETITGIHTGSLYTDGMAHLPGSKLCPTKAGVFIVKTHKSSNLVSRGGCPKDIRFSRAIFILRNPYDAIIAEYNRKMGGKVGFADQTLYTSSSWEKFVNKISKFWEKMTLFWMSKFDRPLHILVYEDLKANTMYEVYRMMNFLTLNVTLNNLYCLVGNQHDRYYRAEKPGWLTKTELFNNGMKAHINEQIKSVYLKFDNTSPNAHILKSYIL